MHLYVVSWLTLFLALPRTNLECFDRGCVQCSAHLVQLCLTTAVFDNVSLLFPSSFTCSINPVQFGSPTDGGLQVCRRTSRGDSSTEILFSRCKIRVLLRFSATCASDAWFSCLDPLIAAFSTAIAADRAWNAAASSQVLQAEGRIRKLMPDGYVVSYMRISDPIWWFADRIVKQAPARTRKPLILLLRLNRQLRI